MSPTRDEYGLYIAAAASLRTIDLSRQIGAAIFSPNGEIISMGSNEVPKAFGGTYWSDDETKARDFERGFDPNEKRKNEILYDLVERLHSARFLSQRIMEKDSTEDRVLAINKSKRISDSQLMDLLEFGRIIHAEMCALADASRVGLSTKGATLFCTTFPCHICAKHLVASGIERVVFLEPYPKSYADEQHSDSITFDRSEKNVKVLMEPFIGISPRRYRDIFEKRKRKDASGKAVPWYEGMAKPRIEDKGVGYIDQEIGAIADALG